MSEAAPLSPLTIVRVLLTRQLLPWLTVIMETLWVYPWMLFATRWETLSWDYPPLSLGSAVALALAAQVVTSALGLAGNWTLNTVRTMVLPALAFLLFFITSVRNRQRPRLLDRRMGRPYRKARLRTLGRSRLWCPLHVAGHLGGT